jgi:IclR family transcriptional regulator, acetate operon repressor
MEMKSVTRSLRILEAVAQHQPVSLAELTKMFELPKSTVQRTLVTLNEAGWLRASRGDTTRWEIGARVLMVRPVALLGTSLLAAAREPMCRLRDAVNETIHLSIPDGLDCMVMVDRVDCTQALRTYHEIGDRSPLHATASGHAVLAFHSAAEINELIEHGLDSYGESTITEPQQLNDALQRVRRAGYAVNRNQYLQGVCAIAAPILDENGTSIAAIAISMPDSRFDPARLPDWGRLVAETAAEISSRRMS